MKNQLQVGPQNKAESPQRNIQNARSLFRTDERKSSPNEGFIALAGRPESEKPSEEEMILFSEIYRWATTDDEKQFGCAFSQLRGFYELVKDNPRIRPLAEALQAMVDAENFLHETAAAMRSL